MCAPTSTNEGDKVVHLFEDIEVTILKVRTQYAMVLLRMKLGVEQVIGRNFDVGSGNRRGEMLV